MKYSHDICLVDCSDTLSSAGLGIVKGISSNPLRGVPGNQFDGLNHTINDLSGMSALNHKVTMATDFVLDARVFTLRIFANENSVDIVVWRFETLDGRARAYIGK